MNKFLVVCTAVALTLGLAGGSAFAAPSTIPADPTAGAMSDVESSVQTWVITYGVPVIFSLLLLGVLIKLGLKWARRGAKAIG